jgi:hypothetical protein
MGSSTAICVERRDEIVERALSLDETSPGDGKEPGGEEFATVRLIPEADLPLNRRTSLAALGKLDSVMLEKREQLSQWRAGLSHPSQQGPSVQTFEAVACGKGGTSGQGSSCPDAHS